MADFVIKPGAGVSNKLILKTQDDTSVLTTSASGVAITAPTIADLSNVTGALPVGVTGGSGLTALGTVTAGNLSNSAIVYPAGHVTKMHFHPLASDVNCTGAGDSTYQTVIISPSSGTSKLYAFHTMHASQGNGGNAQFKQQLAITGSNVTNRTDTSSELYSYSGLVNTYRVRSWMHAPIVLDGTASDVTFLFQIWHDHANNTTYVIGNNTNESSVTIFEVY